MLGDRKYYSYVFVGNAHDNFETTYIDTYIEVDKSEVKEWKKWTIIIAAHELGHNIFQDVPAYPLDPGLHDCPYGLMVGSPQLDFRSYLYGWQIHLFRSELDPFDSVAF